MTLPFAVSTLVLLMLPASSTGIRMVDNDIDVTKVYYKELKPLEKTCKFSGRALDLLFLMDISGSQADAYQQGIDAIKKVLDFVAVAPDHTRVALITFSTDAYTEFNFNKLTSKQRVFEELDALPKRKTGVTHISGALNHSRTVLTPDNGMRDSSVDKVLFLLSDGRGKDLDKMKSMSWLLRQEYSSLKIWAYGLGQSIAKNDLGNMTLDQSLIATKETLDSDIPRMFKDFEGKMTCTDPPVCLPGSDKPMDLLFVTDASNSIGDHKLDEQIKFIERLLTHVELNQEAVKVALISYKGSVNIEFNFNEYSNKTELLARLGRIQGRYASGVTNTSGALKVASAMLDNADSQMQYGIRADVPKVVIMMTDGYALEQYEAPSSQLRALPNVTVYAVAVGSDQANMEELVAMVGYDKSRVFSGLDIYRFEDIFNREHVGFGCAGMEGPFIETMKGPVDIQCEPNGVEVRVRVKSKFFGKIYAKENYNDPACVSSSAMENNVALHVYYNTCGVQHKRTFNKETGEYGVEYSFVAILQFHQKASTVVDKGIAVSCFLPGHKAYLASHGDLKISDQNPQENWKGIHGIQCNYAVRKHSATQCLALQATVGEMLYHTWDCGLQNNPRGLGILVHDCVAFEDDLQIPMIDSNGCELDGYMLETPVYKTEQSYRHGPKELKPFVSQESLAFKFPSASSIQFRCLVSVCDLKIDEYSHCTREIKEVANGSCPQKDGRHINVPSINTHRNFNSQVPTRPGYLLTREVVSRRLNILESSQMNPENWQPSKFCTS